MSRARIVTNYEQSLISQGFFSNMLNARIRKLIVIELAQIMELQKNAILSLYKPVGCIAHSTGVEYNPLN